MNAAIKEQEWRALNVEAGKVRRSVNLIEHVPSANPSVEPLEDSTNNEEESDEVLHTPAVPA